MRSFSFPILSPIVILAIRFIGMRAPQIDPVFCTIICIKDADVFAAGIPDGVSRSAFVIRILKGEKS
jgi:hypothetical protein